MPKKRGRNQKRADGMPKPENQPMHPVEVIHPRPLKFMSEKLKGLVKGRLWLKVTIGLILGIIVGFLLGPTMGLVDPQLASIITEWLALPGGIFLSIIQMIVIPLIFASIITGIASSESVKQLKKTGIAIAGYFLIMTVLAILIGVVLAGWIQPGQYVDHQLLQEGFDANSIPTDKFSTPTIGELPAKISSLLPINLLRSMIQGEMLQIVIFAIIFGIALISMHPKQAKPVLELFSALQRICMTIIKWAMLLAPIAVFGLMTKVTSRFGIDTLAGVGIYVCVVLLGLVIIMLVYLALLYFAVGTNPFWFLREIKDVMLLAFSTSSSAVVMPLSLKTAEERLNIRPSLARLIIPIGTTMNMAGTALYQGVAVIFIAQVFDVGLGTTALIFLIITIMGASIGSPATPGAGMAILAGILANMGIPVSGLLLIFGVDRILDMSRTTLNVAGDLTAGVLINKFTKGEISMAKLKKEEEKHEKIRAKTGHDIVIHHHKQIPKKFN